jgi:hypothetical protein
MWRWSFSSVCKLRGIKAGPLSSSDTEVNPLIIRSWIKALIWMSLMSESQWWNLFHTEVKSWDYATWFRTWQYQTPAWKWYLQTHLLAERFVFLGVDDRGFLKEEVKTYLMAPMSILNSLTSGLGNLFWGSSRGSLRIFLKNMLFSQNYDNYDKKWWYKMFLESHFGWTEPFLRILLKILEDPFEDHF